jgi:hypothetical protein
MQHESSADDCSVQQHRLGFHRRRHANALSVASADEHPEKDHDHAHVQRRPLRRCGVNHATAIPDQLRPFNEPHMYVSQIPPSPKIHQILTIMQGTTAKSATGRSSKWTPAFYAPAYPESDSCKNAYGPN